MRDDELRSRISELNPWWRTPPGVRPTSWADDDRLLRDRAAYDLGYRPDVLDDVARDPIGDALMVVQRPGRVGKSVALKDTAVGLCGRLAPGGSQPRAEPHRDL